MNEDSDGSDTPYSNGDLNLCTCMFFGIVMDCSFLLLQKRSGKNNQKKKKKKKKKGVMDVMRFKQLVRHPRECRKMRKLEKCPCFLILT
jgi:hypothetical protein